MMEKIEATYRFIEFGPHYDGSDLIVCRNRKSKDILGCVRWYLSWKQYVFQADELAVFSHDCLADIQDYLKKQTAARKK